MRRLALGFLLGSFIAACGPAPSAQTPMASQEPAVAEPAQPESGVPAEDETTGVAESGETGDIAEVEPSAEPLPSAEAPVAVEAPPSDVPGANMHVSQVTTDGVTIEKVDCRSEGGGLGGLLGTLVIGKPFADRKAQLDRCVQGSHKTRVRWTAVGGKMTNVKVISGDNPANACIERALNGAMATVAGECAASVEIGK